RVATHPATIGKTRLEAVRTATKCQPIRGASQAMIRCMPKSDHAVMYATSGPSAIPEFDSTTSSGTLTIGPPGVITPAALAITMAVKPDCLPKEGTSVSCG